MLIITTSAHSQEIGQRTVSYKDEHRGRPLVTEIWYPTKDTLKQSDKKFSPFLRKYTVRDGKLPMGKFPLIMVSHDTGGGRLTLEWIAQGLVENGFIVAAVDHWGNTMDNKIPIEFLKPWERPQDISFVLTKLFIDPLFKGSIDQKRIGAVGYSFGGYTVLAIAGAVIDYPKMLKYYKNEGRKEMEAPELPGLYSLLDDPKLIAGTKNVPVLKDKRISAFLQFLREPGLAFLPKNSLMMLQIPFLLPAQNLIALRPL